MSKLTIFAALTMMVFLVGCKPGTVPPNADIFPDHTPEPEVSLNPPAEEPSFVPLPTQPEEPWEDDVVLETVTLTLWGDGLTFAAAIFMDNGTPEQEQLHVLPTTIGVGEQLTYSVTGEVLNDVQVTRSYPSRTEIDNGDLGDPLYLEVRRNGVLEDWCVIDERMNYNWSLGLCDVF